MRPQSVVRCAHSSAQGNASRRSSVRRRRATYPRFPTAIAEGAATTRPASQKSAGERGALRSFGRPLGSDGLAHSSRLVCVFAFLLWRCRAAGGHERTDRGPSVRRPARHRRARHDRPRDPVPVEGTQATRFRAHLLDSGRRCGRCAARHCRTEVGCGGCAHGTHPPAAVPSEYSLGPACRLDAIFCCVGGGGLVSGIAAYVKSVRPDVR